MISKRLLGLFQMSLVALAAGGGCSRMESVGDDAAGDEITSIDDLRRTRDLQGGAASDRRYSVQRGSPGLEAHNPLHRFAIAFDPEAVHIRGQWGTTSLTTRSIGRQGAMQRVTDAEPRASANRVSFERDGFTEWYENGPLGLEQGYDLERRPGGFGDVLVEVRIAGLTPSVDRSGAVILSSPDGDRLRYHGLIAVDARDQRLASSLSVDGSRVVLRVDDRNAVYPVLIDPLIATLVQDFTVGDSNGGFGRALGLDDDLLVVGAGWASTIWGSQIGPQSGVLYPYRWADDDWEPGTPSSGPPDARLGERVRVSGNLVAASSNGGFRSIFTYRDTGTSLGALSPLLQPDDSNTFGIRFDMVGDTLIAGIFGDDTGGVNAGRARIFRLNDSGHFAVEDDVFGTVARAEMGRRVALSEENAFIDNDDPNELTQMGMYSRSPAGWQRISGIVGPPEGENATNDAIVAHGYTLAWGASERDLSTGSVYVYQYDGSEWQETLLVPDDAVSGNQVGMRLALSGNLLAVNGDNVVYVFQRVGDTWEEAATITSEDAGAELFGLAIALDGRRLAVGGTADTGESAYMFELSTDGLNGSPCQDGSDCTSGVCVDHVCCNEPCGPCHSCKAVEKASGADGFCAPVQAGLDPNSDCENEGVASCGQNGLCDGAGSCELYPSGADCGNGCDDLLVQQRQCNGTGQCVAISVLEDCSPQACANGACADCTDNVDCPGGMYCSIGDCLPVEGDGELCTDGAQCQSGFCVDGFCCDSECQGVCEACGGHLTVGGIHGVCDATRSGVDPHNDCESTEIEGCGLDGTCNGNRACRLYPEGTQCGATCSGSSLVTEECDGAGACQLGGSMTECSPGICRNGACSVCNLEEDCPPGFFCDEGVCVDPGAVGAPCDDSNECDSGFCIEGTCCDSACDQTCQSCTAEGKGEGVDGICGLARAGADPQEHCVELGALSCATNGQCDGAGNCQLYPEGTPCGLTSCAGNQLAGEVCDGLGVCVDSMDGLDCAPFVCESGSCRAVCSEDTHCVDGAVCRQGQCGAPLPTGEPCERAAQCQSGFCVDAVCCDTECDAGCHSCLAAQQDLGAGTDGVCGPIADGADPRGACEDQGRELCEQDGSCNGAGQCRRYSPASCEGGGGMTGNGGGGSAGEGNGGESSGGTTSVEGAAGMMVGASGAPAPPDGSAMGGSTGIGAAGNAPLGGGGSSGAGGSGAESNAQGGGSRDSTDTEKDGGARSSNVRPPGSSAPNSPESDGVDEPTSNLGDASTSEDSPNDAPEGCACRVTGRPVRGSGSVFACLATLWLLSRRRRALGPPTRRSRTARVQLFE